MHVVLGQELVRDHDVINVAKDESVFIGVTVFLLQERDGVVAPVAAGVEVVGGVVAVIEAETVTLCLLA